MNPNSDEARDGTAKHVALADVGIGREPDTAAIAERFGVDRDEIDKAVAYGKRVIAQLREIMPNPIAEVRVEGPVTVGTADLLQVTRTDSADPFYSPDDIASLVVLDWKTGASHDEHVAQLAGYADAARESYGMPLSGVVTTIEVWVSFSEYRIRNYAASQLDYYRVHMRNQIEHAGEQWGPGPACKFCPRRLECSTFDEFVRTTANAVAPIERGTIISRERLGELYRPSRELARALEHYDALLTAALEDGPIELSDGSTIRLVDLEKSEIDPIVLAQALRAREWSDEEIRRTLRASKTTVEEIAGTKVQKRVNGGKAGYMRALMSDLRAADGVSTKTYKQKRVIEP